jgi:Putative zinc-finger
MSCDRTEKLSLLIDGELSPVETSAIERHLLQCQDCQQVRADFLSLRTEISAYSPLLEPETARGALAQVLSKPSQTDSQGPTVLLPNWRNRFLGAFNVPRFNYSLSAIAALLLIVFTIGTIAFLRNRSQRGDLSNNQAPQESGSVSANLANAVSSASGDRRRKPSKVGQGASAPNSGKPGSKLKPAPERSAPKQLPQPRSSAPPTYALVEAPVTPLGVASVRPADPETLTLRHLEQSELLLRAFRNVRLARKSAGAEIGYERQRAQQLVYQNILLRREAEGSGDVQVATLLGSLEPILLDIANLPDKTQNDEVRAIQQRVERKSLVALLQVNSAAVARANE